MTRRDPLRQTQWQTASPFLRTLLVVGVPLLLIGAGFYQAVWPGK